MWLGEKDSESDLKRILGSILERISELVPGAKKAEVFELSKRRDSAPRSPKAGHNRL